MCAFRVNLYFFIFLVACSLFRFTNAVDTTAATVLTSVTSLVSQPTVTSESSVASETSTKSTIPSTLSTLPATVSTQSTAATTTIPVKRQCNELSVMENIDIQRISGTWYELARKGYGTYIQNVQCLQMDIFYQKDTAVVFQKYATALTTIDNQPTYQYIVRYNSSNVSDYNITYTDYSYVPVPTYKILDTDYDNYLIVCSYLPVWENSAAAFVYFRKQNTPDDDVYSVVNNAITKYSDFTGMNLVYQGPRCNSVSRVLPVGLFIYLIFAFYTVKFTR